jgi:hypothetical protein
MSEHPCYLYLHIGVHKTGTSALQAAFAKNVDPLLASNVLYPDYWSLAKARDNRITSGNGVPVAKLMGVPLPTVPEDDTAKVLEDLANARASGRNVLYSSETMDLFDPVSTRAFRDQVRELGFEVRVVAYFRAIADHAHSYYQQQIKHGVMTRTFTEYLLQDYAVEMQSHLVHKMLDVFETREIIARNYDRAKDALIPDFLAGVLGLQDISAFDTAPAQVNRSHSDIEAALLRTMAPLFANAQQSRIASDAMIYCSPNAHGKRSISSESMRIITERHADALAVINRLLPDAPIALKSDGLEVSDQPESQLTEAEKALAAMIAGLIRFTSMETRLS